MPVVSVVMPVYNSAMYVSEAIESILNQTYSDWELLVINEFDTNDGSDEIIEKYCNMDSRIILIKNKKKLGLAESLNIGIVLAKGKYIARLDADDISRKDRLEKQVNFMYEHPNIGLCGSYQHHFGPDIDWIHKPAITPEQCKANLLFFCDVCHSTVMIKREILIENNLKYDKHYLAEDYELWTRVAEVCDIANIPEILGEYRWGKNNITLDKLENLRIESGKIVAKNLRRNLNLKLDDNEISLLNNWKSPIKGIPYKEKKLKFKQAELLLRKIYIRNQEIGYYDNQSLLNVIYAKWNWLKYFAPFNRMENINSIDEVFRDEKNIYYKRIYYFWTCNKGLKNKLRKIKNFIKK